MFIKKKNGNAQIDNKHKDGGKEIYLMTQNGEKQQIITFWKVETSNIWHYSCKIVITIAVIDEKTDTFSWEISQLIDLCRLPALVSLRSQHSYIIT